MPFNRKHDESTKQKISRALKRKGEKGRKALSKGLTKAAGLTGYGTGRVVAAGGAKKAKKLSKNEKVQEVLQNENFKDIKKASIKALEKGANKVFDATTPGTRLKTSGAFIGGYAKGSRDGKRKKRKDQT